MTKNNLAIIVLNWNGADDALECISSLARQTLKPTIIVVDNHSHDDSVMRFEQYQTEHPSVDCIIIANNKNLGFAGGINTGLVYAREQGFKYIGVLNPDAILTKNGAKHSSTNCQASQNAVLQLVFYNGATAKRLIQLATSIPPGACPVHETATSLLKMRRVSLARFLARLAAERFIARQFLTISICSTRIFSCITKMSTSVFAPN